jgi:hypothetical protein
MPSSAPRIDSRLVAAIARFDKPGWYIADTHRAIGLVAEHLGLSRPSYQQTRVIVHQLRRRRRDPSVGQVLLDIAFRVKPPDALLDALSGTPY